MMDFGWNLETAISDIRNTRLVACVDAYPVYPSRMGSEQIKQFFSEHPNVYFTNDGRSIYFDENNKLLKNLNPDSVKDHLIKEYAHLFLQHTRLRRYYEKDEIKANTFAIACEIEACRTLGIRKDGSCYKSSATDKLFPCTKKAKHLRQIYQALLDEYGNQIEELANPEGGKKDGDESDNRDGDSSRGDGARDNSGDQANNGDDQQGDSRPNQHSDRGDGGHNDNGDSSGGGSSGSDGNHNGSGAKSRMGDGEDSEQDREGDGRSKKSQSNSSSADEQSSKQKRQSFHSTNSDKLSSGQSRGSQGDEGLPQSDGGKSKLSKKQKQVLEKTFGDNGDKPSPKDGDDEFYQQIGYSATGESEERSINENMDLAYDRWRDKQVKNQLKKLKSAIAGEVSRIKHPTYARPSRRVIMENGLLTKGRKKDLVGQPKILVALDASGSMSAQRVKDLTTTIGNIFDDLGRPKQGCYICLFDTHIIDCQPIRKWKDVVKKYQAMGGTGYPCVVKKAIELNVDVVIEVGDGCGLITESWQKSDYKSFEDGTRKWYDLLVQHNAKELNYAFNNHISYDFRGGVKREVICLDEDMALELKQKSMDKSLDE